MARLRRLGRDFHLRQGYGGQVGEPLTVADVRAVRHSLTLQPMDVAFVGRMMEGETSTFAKATADRSVSR